MSKPSRKSPSLSTILAVTVLIASALVWAAVYGVGIALMYWPESGGFDRQLRLFANGLVKVTESNLDRENLKVSLSGLNLVITEFAGDNQGVVGFNVWDARGNWVVGSLDVPRIGTEAYRSVGFFDVDANGEIYRIYSRWTSNRSFRIDVLQSERSRRADFNSVMLSPASIVLPILVVLPLVLLPVLLVVRFGLKPLRKLSEALAQRHPDDLQPVHMDDLVSELQPVVDEVNGTLGRLDALLRRERDFLADAAHELRTPLAVISAQADEVLRADKPEARAQAERYLKAGLGRANRLVNQLLVLARFEAQADSACTPTDAADIVRDCLASYAREARAKSIQLAYHGPDRMPTPGAGHALESIVGNLVGNAVRYGRRGGHIQVRIDEASHGAFSLAVWDDGPGIPPDERARMFDRFRRGSQTGASGAGLGLAIVASAARLLDARIRVEAGIGDEGVCVILDIPGHGKRGDPVNG